MWGGDGIDSAGREAAGGPWFAILLLAWVGWLLGSLRLRYALLTTLLFAAVSAYSGLQTLVRVYRTLTHMLALFL